MVRRTGEPVAGPLAGLLVADFSRVLAGPYATMLLGDLGADVIKVESPSGDDTRQWMPPARDGVATYYLSVNRNKRSVVLDLADPRDALAARELARRADVLVENFKPGGLARFGLDYDAVRRDNPRVVYCSITGFGPTGGAALPGYDLIVQAVSGLMSLQGAADGPPWRAGVAVFDVVAGLHAALGVLAALQARGSTGPGQRVEVDLLSSALSGLVNQSAAHVLTGTVPHRMGNAHPSLTPYEPLPTADADLVVAVGNDAQFRRFCAVIGRPELGEDPDYARNVDRTRNRDRLRPLLVQALAARGAREWFSALSAAGVPCGPIQTVAEGVDLAAELGLEPVVTVGSGDDALPGLRNPLRLSATPASYRRSPPALGADTQSIRAWLLGEAAGQPGLPD